MEQLEEVINIEIAAAAVGGSVKFTPQPGLVVACAIFTNGAENPGFVTAKITNDAGEIISPASDIRNYRDREASYLEGKKPLHFETKGKTYVLEVFATAGFTTAFKAQLVLVYERTYQNC